MTLLGRHPDSDIMLDDITVSRRHVAIERTPEGYVVRDEGSLNGTYINQERVDRAVLRHGDELQIGKFRLVLFERAMAELNASHLSIGEVLGLLLEEFPDITISKIRFLESQGLIEPERTPSGYRKFYEHDVELLRLILREQREHFLPLRVIKDRLDAGVIETASTPPPRQRRHPEQARATRQRRPPSPSHPAAGRNGRSDGLQAGRHRRVEPPAARRQPLRLPTVGRPPTTDTSPRLLPGVVVSRDELCAMASITVAQLASLEEYGVIGRRKGRQRSV